MTINIDFTGVSDVDPYALAGWTYESGGARIVSGSWRSNFDTVGTVVATLDAAVTDSGTIGFEVVQTTANSDSGDSVSWGFCNAAGNGMVARANGGEVYLYDLVAFAIDATRGGSSGQTYTAATEFRVDLDKDADTITVYADGVAVPFAAESTGASGSSSDWKPVLMSTWDNTGAHGVSTVEITGESGAVAQPDPTIETITFDVPDFLLLPADYTVEVEDDNGTESLANVEYQLPAGWSSVAVSGSVVTGGLYEAAIDNFGITPVSGDYYIYTGAVTIDGDGQVAGAEGVTFQWRLWDASASAYTVEADYTTAVAADTSGTLISNLESTVLTSNGQLTVTGSVVNLLDSSSISNSSVISLSGTVTETLDNVIGVLTGDGISVIGALNSTLDAITNSTSGVLTNVGSITGSSSTTSSFLGSISNLGVIATNLEDITSDITGQVYLVPIGSITVQLEDTTSLSSGVIKQDTTGTVVATLDEIDLTAVGNSQIVGVVNSETEIVVIDASGEITGLVPIPPVITIIGGLIHTVHPKSNYTDPVATARDSLNVNVSDTAEWSGDIVDTNTTLLGREELTTTNGVVLSVPNGQVGFTPSGELPEGTYKYEAKALDSNGDEVIFAVGTYTVSGGS